MAKELNFTDGVDVIKYQDATSTLHLTLSEDGVPFDLTRLDSLTVKIGNENGYLMEKPVDLSGIDTVEQGNITIKLDGDIMNRLVPDDYQLELWGQLNPVQYIPDSNSVTISINEKGLDDVQVIFPTENDLVFTVDDNEQQTPYDDINTYFIDDVINSIKAWKNTTFDLLNADVSQRLQSEIHTWQGDISKSLKDDLIKSLNDDEGDMRKNLSDALSKSFEELINKDIEEAKGTLSTGLYNQMVSTVQDKIAEIKPQITNDLNGSISKELMDEVNKWQDSKSKDLDNQLAQSIVNRTNEMNDKLSNDFVKFISDKLGDFEGQAKNDITNDVLTQLTNKFTDKFNQTSDSFKKDLDNQLQTVISNSVESTLHNMQVNGSIAVSEKDFEDFKNEIDDRVKKLNLVSDLQPFIDKTKSDINDLNTKISQTKNDLSDEISNQIKSFEKETLKYKGNVTGIDANNITETGIYAITGNPAVNHAPDDATGFKTLIVHNNGIHIIQTEICEHQWIPSWFTKWERFYNGTWHEWSKIPRGDEALPYLGTLNTGDTYELKSERQEQGYYLVSSGVNKLPIKNGGILITIGSIGRTFCTQYASGEDGTWIRGVGYSWQFPHDNEWHKIITDKEFDGVVKYRGEINDANNATQEGTYRIDNASNLPFENSQWKAMMLHVWNVPNTNYIMQACFPLWSGEDKNEMWIRSFGGGHWNKWKKVATNDDIDNVNTRVNQVQNDLINKLSDFDSNTLKYKGSYSGQDVNNLTEQGIYFGDNFQNVPNDMKIATTLLAFNKYQDSSTMMPQIILSAVNKNMYYREHVNTAWIKVVNMDDLINIQNKISGLSENVVKFNGNIDFNKSFNDVIETGIYINENPDEIMNMKGNPDSASGHGYLVVIKYSDSYIQQKYYDDHMYNGERFKVNGNWTDWKTFSTSDDVDSVNNKVNQIQNNLLNKLSILNDNSLQNMGSLNGDVDIDTIKKAGIYNVWANGFSADNFPLRSEANQWIWGSKILIVTNINNNILQILAVTDARDATNKIVYRTCFDGVWRDWQKIVNSNDLNDVNTRISQIQNDVNTKINQVQNDLTNEMNSYSRNPLPKVQPKDYPVGKFYISDNPTNYGLPSGDWMQLIDVEETHDNTNFIKSIKTVNSHGEEYFRNICSNNDTGWNNNSSNTLFYDTVEQAKNALNDAPNNSIIIARGD